MKQNGKSIPVTFRVTKEEHESLTKLARENNQSVSQYVTDRVFGACGVTKTQQRRVYHSLLKIKDAVYLYGEQELSDTVKKECDVLWQCLSW